ncbi:protein bicaudal C isoform X1 [Cephus cinctus]|uniref:Protein bicaudal C isoform X1 n=2 Tax=Cephus cinctus TaxID=211228 RepID=A0AAJ7RIG2_CEPCN|nr:protein bicaudal C isoform X1 [Cephus cinctus]XP_024941529.1 protein bicaudal C isoform X1 [Cephus cinctus]XP_024941530.1 protein bicaudal C isoform X1 [Cephus cinctus]XP_024941531.1 protein bicaudal C isoform X1 [Cephus cinctus]
MMRPDELIQSERRATETMSETSEGTGTTSVSGKSGFESREELRDVAAILGIVNPEELHQDRFRVDRRKLEHMLLGDNEAPEPADTFFHKVMEETNTFVTWPSRLKIGAKSKKDPHIKVAGRPDDVRTAKDKIMQILDTRQSNRVTMKVDVSYTDHSHIIGKGGLTIKRVMEETSCHIHFPDSNRSNHQEKSNQVSIAGEIEGVERARCRVRNLTPLIFSFELPVMGAAHAPPDSTSPYVVRIQEKYNVQVMFRTRPKLHATLVLVKGCEWEVLQVKEATVLLIHYMCENLASQIQVQMSMEISPQHHSIVLGKQSSNLKMIMQCTATQIIFPDAGDPNIPSLKKSNVTITGGIHNVYLARQQLVGSLPLVLMFDLPEHSMPSVDTENISQLMQSLDVFINVRHKPKQSTFSVIIKGIERNAGNIYEARNQLLGLNEPRIHAEIPDSYHIPNAGSVFQGNSSNNNGNINGASRNNVAGLPENFSSMLTVNTQNLPYCMSPMSNSPNPMGMSPHWGMTAVPSMFSPLPVHHHGPFSYPHLNHMLSTQQMMHNNLMGHPQGAWNQTLSGLGQSQTRPSSGYHSMNSLNSSSLTNNKDGSGYSSLSSVSSSLSSPAISPRNASPVNPSDVTSTLDLSSMLSDLSGTDRRAPGCEKKSLQMAAAHHNLTPFDYEQKKLMAVKAMQTKLNSPDYRVPTSSWSGYGLSQTIPLMTNSDLSKDSSSHPSDLWEEPKTPVFGTTMDFGIGADKDQTPQVGISSNYLDHTPTSQINKITSQHYTDLASMLTNVGLEKYIRLFTSHEVDMATFPSLTDKDLCEIGVTAWGARRKILLLISEMNKRSSPFSGSAAPGAERKSSTTSSTATTSKCSLENW